LQIFTKFLYFESFLLQNFIRIIRVSELMWKFIRMPVTCCSCRGTSENCCFCRGTSENCWI